MNLNELCSRACSGDSTAEQELFRRLSARFQLFVKHRVRDAADAEEVVQDALKTVFEKYRGVEFETSFAAWAYKVLENKLLTYHRSVQRRGKRLVELSNGIPADDQHTRSDMVESALLECLRQVSIRNRRHARILNLHYHGYTVDEICAKLGLTRANFYSVLSRARAMLLECLKRGKVL